MTFVLIHSPSVGPRTWQSVADELRRRGNAVAVPDLRSLNTEGPPFWQHVRDAVTGPIAAGRTDLVLVPHSNAGVFVPVVAMDETVRARVRGSVFVDAALPAVTGFTPVAAPEFLTFLRGKARDGLLPRWTDWWDEADVAPMFPDPATREGIVAEQPRLPLAYYEAQVPAPAGWDRLPCAYLWFGPPYDQSAAEAEGRGWPVRRLPGEHLHAIVDPAGVADAILALSAAW